MSRVITQEGAAEEAASVVVRDVLSVRRGETVLISLETYQDRGVADLLISAVEDVSAIPVMLTTPKNDYPGGAPAPVVESVSQDVDVWIELNEYYYLGTAVHHIAEMTGLRRFYSLPDVTPDELVTYEHGLDRSTITGLGDRLAELITNCDRLEVTCANGSSFRASCKGRSASQDTSTMSLGQTHISPVESTLEGSLVFDGAVFPPAELGRLSETVRVDFKGTGAYVAPTGDESLVLLSWQEAIGDTEIHQLDHFSFGFHPRILQPSGRLVADERVFGGLCIGLGPHQPYSCHTDLTITKPTVIVDGTVIQESGEYVDPLCRKLARQLGVPGY